jgi:hypothetical protein
MTYTIENGIKNTKAKFKKLAVGLVAVAMPAAIAISSGAASAASGYTLFGDASIVSGGNPGNAVQLVSDTSATSYAGIDFETTSGITFADLNTLSTDFNPTDDGCLGGSPRFQINVDVGGGTIKNIFSYIGTDSGSPACVNGTWQSSTDLLETGKLIDTSQVGGTFYDTYDNALAAYGSLPVTGIQLVEDAGWAFPDGEQTALVDNTQINDTVYTYELTKEDCKNGGWQTLTDQNGHSFKNQGQCVAYMNHNDGHGQDDVHAHVH